MDRRLASESSSHDTVEYASGIRTLSDGSVLPQPVQVDLGAASHCGLVRPNNEDHYAAVRRIRKRDILKTNVDVSDLVLPEDHAYVLVVADGVGGRGFGELASELVLRLGWDVASQMPCWIMKFDDRLMFKIREQVESYARQIQAALQEEIRSNPALAGMGTTWTCVYTMGTDAIVAHAGDSRAYRFHRGTLKQLTRDHTLAQEMQTLGMPAEEAARFKHMLTNSFGGPGGEVVTDVEHVPLEDGDRILLCTDGLTDMATDLQIAEVLARVSGSQAAADALIDLALAHGGKDNVTAIVADYRVSAGGPA
ncbi:MAG: PP2C family protein-serine/threonine phosphatase [Planctomycetales bacterium]